MSVITGENRLTSWFSVQVPTWIWWCTDDRTFHPSGAEILGDTLPNATVETPSGCGHVPMLDVPKQTATRYLSFLSKTQ